MDSITRRLVRLARESLRALVGAAPERTPKPPRGHTPTPVPGRDPARGARAATDAPVLPDFDYAPNRDGHPDPGEIVWTWVPYEDDPTRGKDRPVLVVARAGAHVVVAQLTSQDHDRDAADEARWGRYWYDIGSGDWDPQGRPSEVRLDRLLRVSPDAVRREGGILDERLFREVVGRLQQVQGAPRVE